MKEIITLFKRDLEKVVEEIRQYPDEQSLWVTAEGINNPGGNLVWHLVGNLNHFIGATLGNTDYVRNRETEFTDKNIPSAELIMAIHDVSLVIQNVLGNLPENEWKKEFPIKVFGYAMTTEHFMIHLYGHLNYHLGQINYHRRLLVQ